MGERNPSISAAGALQWRSGDGERRMVNQTGWQASGEETLWFTELADLF